MKIGARAGGVVAHTDFVCAWQNMFENFSDTQEYSFVFSLNKNDSKNSHIIFAIVGGYFCLRVTTNLTHD